MVLVATQVKRRRGTTAENDAFTGAEGEITVDTEKHELRVHDGETQGGFVIGGGSGSGRNIGDIFYTTRTDTALAGAVECNGGTYNTEDYTGAGSIGELLAGGKLPYVSLAEYATLLSTNGVVGVFGWDGGSGNWYGWTDGSDILYTKTLTNPDTAYDYPEDDRIAGDITSSTSTTITVRGFGTYTRDSSKDISGTLFRVPTLQDVFIECGQASQLGNYISAGLPNIAGDIEVSQNLIYDATGAFSLTKGQGYVHYSGIDANACTGIYFDASKDNSIYGNSNTVQPKAVKYRAMVQLFNGTTDEAVATVGTVVAQVGALNTRTAGMIDYVVESQDPTAENGYTWYRLYKSGWVEQGGNVSGGTSQTPNFPIEMADIHYAVAYGNMSGTYEQVKTTTKTTTSITIRNANNGGTVSTDWQVAGKSAQ